MMFDSNLIIYAARPEYPGLRRRIAVAPVVSAVVDRELHTRNVADFNWIPGLVVVDPLAAGDPY